MNGGRAAFVAICLILLVATVSATNITVYAVDTNTDARITRAVTNKVWSDIRDGAGTAILNTTAQINGVFLVAHTTSNRYNLHARYGWVGNTSSLPDDAIIDSATFGIYGYGNITTLGLVDITVTGFHPTNSSVLQISDYTKYDQSVVSSNISFNWAGWNHFPITNTSVISKTDRTMLMVRNLWDVNNAPPTWVSGAQTYYSFNETSATANVPYLEISYHTPMPASITGLGNSTTCSSINWTWTNPTLANFNHTTIYKDSAWLKNVSNATTFDLWESLTAETEYTFGSKTCDAAGACNTTWVNQTASTPSCSATPVASFYMNKNLLRFSNLIVVTDTSTNTPTSWEWQWGDGTANSTTQNPTHQYKKRGKYTIYLTATNAGGSGSTAGTNSSVRVYGYDYHY